MKTRQGFISNSSSSSFVVAYKKLNFSKPGWQKETLLTSAQVKKLKRFGFKYTYINNPYFVNIKGFELVNNLKELKNYDSVYFWYDVVCNQYEVLYFLFINKIPFVALCHYDQELVIWDGKHDCFFEMDNVLEKVCKENGNVDWNLSKQNQWHPSQLQPTIKPYKITEWLKDHEKLTKSFI